MSDGIAPTPIWWIILDDDCFTVTKYEDRIPELIDGVLRYGDIDRGSAASALALFGESASAAVPALKKALEDEVGSVRISAARALWKIAREEEPVFNILMNDLESTDEHVRSQAAEVLSFLAREFSPERALIAFRRLISDHDDSETRRATLAKYIRLSGVRGLSRMHPEISGVIDLLKEALNDPDEEVRQAARQALA